MSSILNITNGDSAVEIMQQAKFPGIFLPWRDVLHDGPVPDGLSLEKLSEVRAKFIIERNWGYPEDIKRHFIERDNTLKSFQKYDKVILWFEHDLYDQLQLLQILDWFYQNKLKDTALSIICVNQYLGMLSPDEMKTLLKYEEPVTENHLMLANNAWSAFRSDSPEKWHTIQQTGTATLPFLAGAITRLLEEYPNCKNGLSRTAQQALKIVAQGEKHPANVFVCYQESEARRFLGDSSFWSILHDFLTSSPPLLKLSGGQEFVTPTNSHQELTITPEGKEVLSGKRNWLNIVMLDRWIGGVHLTPDNSWCWHSQTNSIMKHVCN
jgi:hypothetical protein